MKEEHRERTAAETRKLAAIMFTDMVGFSSQMGSNEARMLRLLEIHNQLIQQAVTEHHGAVIKTVGDAFLVDFPSVVHAVQCAQQIQSQFRTHNVEKAKAEQIHVRIGIHLGDVVQKDGDVFGDGVNIAARLQALAEPDSTCISQKVYEEVAKKLDLGTVVSLGRPKLKNIAERFQVYALLPESLKSFRQQLQVQRFQLSRRLSPAHRAVAVALLFLAGGLLVGQYLWRSPLSTQSSALSPSAALPLPDKPSIVVLPFDNMSKDPKQDYFSNGITEVLTSDLSRISSLFVIARNTAFTYKDKAANVQEVGKELGVRYVLEGSVQRAEEQVRIVAQLIDATTGGHLWTERYDRPFKDIFALQDEIVQKIVTTLKLQLTLQEQGYIVRKRTDNPAAYDYWLRGTDLILRFTKEGSIQGQHMFAKAIEMDPQYAQAYASWCWSYLMEWLVGGGQDLPLLERAFELGQKAIVLDNSLPHAHRALGRIYLVKKQHDQAINEAEQAVALDPNEAENHQALADMLTFAGRSEEAIAVMEKAIRLNPQHPPYYLWTLGRAYFLTGRHEQAIEVGKEALARSRNPLSLLTAHLGLALVYSELGQEAEARTEVAEVLRINPSFSLEKLRATLPYKDPVVFERYIAALRKAGLK